MKVVKLSREWKFDPTKQLGSSGGFGAVFDGMGPEGETVAIKQFHPDSHGLAAREIAVAQSLKDHKLPHVIPIYDAGIDSDTAQCAIVMARADRSLQSLLDLKGRLSESEAIEVLDQIAAGLEEIANVVHRDLKPANVLSHNGLWKLTDLGISRFADANTSVHTLKGFLSPQYAAPEQWQSQRATKATDVYALGCIAHSLITGHPPFAGPTESDYHDQHVRLPAPELPASNVLRQLANLCLRKQPEARPSLISVRNLLSRARRGTTDEASALLAAAGAEIAKERAITDAQESQKITLQERYEQLASTGLDDLETILNALFKSIVDDAPETSRKGNGVSLGVATLTYDIPFRRVAVGAFSKSNWEVAAGAYMRLVQQNRTYPGRSTNLWFGKLKPEDGFRWWEVAYMPHPAIRGPRRPDEPFGFVERDGVQAADNAAGRGPGIHQIASGPKSIDADEAEIFIARWKRRFALAVTGNLNAPSVLPERD